MDNRREQDGGFTLIEVLVVLALIAISASIVTLGLPKTPSDRSLAQEADLLVARLNVAAERSLIQGQTFRMAWTTDAYEFSEISRGEWQPSPSGSLPAKHALTADAALSNQSGGRMGEIRIAPDLLPPASGIVELTLSAGSLRRTIIFDGMRARLGGPA